MQTSSPAQSAAGVPGACEAPAHTNVSPLGCYLVAITSLGVLPATSVFWHLYEYTGQAEAQAAAGPRGTVVQSQGRIWVYTIAAQDWQPGSGERVGVVGPLAVSPEKQYTARYMEATFAPGMRTAVHRHAGTRIPKGCCAIKACNRSGREQDLPS